ncbi:MAG: SIMPL domain-containing protein [Patescibacteria group bacterium]
MMRFNFWQIFALILVAIIAIGLIVWRPWEFSINNVSEITVTGEGKVQAVPDLAELSIDVNEKDKAADVTRQKTNEKISALLTALKAKGVSDSDIKTGSISVNQSYSGIEGGGPANGYEGNATIEITIRDIAKAQDIANTVTALGVSRVNGPELKFDDKTITQLKEKARANALIELKQKADQTAQDSGGKSGDLFEFHEGDVRSLQTYPYSAKPVAVDFIQDFWAVYELRKTK